MTTVRNRLLVTLALTALCLAAIAPFVHAVESLPEPGWSSISPKGGADTNSGEPDTPHGAPQPNRYAASPAPRSEAGTTQAPTGRAEWLRWMVRAWLARYVAVNG